MDKGSGHRDRGNMKLIYERVVETGQKGMGGVEESGIEKNTSIVISSFQDGSLEEYITLSKTYF